MHTDVIIASLSKVSLLANLRPEDLRHLASTARERVYRTGSSIVLQDDINASLFVIVSGCVKVHRTTERGLEVVLAILGPNEYFGELSFIDGLPRSAAVSAIENTRAIEVTSESLRTATLASRELAWDLLKVLAYRIRQQNIVVENLATRDVPGRIADLLLRLCQNHGRPYASSGNTARVAAPPSAEPTLIALALSQSEIGTLVGASREQVNRVMSTMKRNRIIDKDEATGRTVVLNRERLQKMVDTG